MQLTAEMPATDTLRANGQKVTSQRLMVFQAMEGRTDHPAAEDVFLTVRETLPTISRGTVYKILNELVEFGESSQIFTNPKEQRTENYITGRFG